MASTPAAGEASAKAFLQRQAKALRLPIRLPVALGLAGIVCGIAQAWAIAALLARLLGLGEAGWWHLAAAAGLGLAGVVLGLAREHAQLAAGEAARANIRGAAFARLLQLGPADPRGVGDRAALLVDQVEALDGYFSKWLPAASLAILGPALVALAAAWADPTAALILLGAGLCVPVGMAVTGIGAAQASRRQFGALQRLSGRFLDRMRGLNTLVLFNRQEAEALALAATAEELRQRTMRVLRVAFLSSTVLELVSAGAIALVAWQHAGRGADPTAGFFALLLVPAFFAPLRAFSGAYHERLAARGAAAELAPLLEGEAPGGQLLLEEVPPRVVVACTDVRLSYAADRAPALDGLTFQVKAGETLVLAGPSGSGKTSVLRLLMGFALPDAGRVAINGQDITLLRPEELRRLSAYVGQHPHLFRASLAENIRFARPAATDTELAAAAEAAGVAGFAAALPQGLDTMLGEGGYGLSGGQAQRVAIARAFLRDSPLVLLDEPTAHLDPATEAALLEAIRRLCLGRTAIIASHSALAQARLGRVLRLEAGRAAAAPLLVQGGD